MNRAATTNMAASDEDFILGDDFDAIMAALEDNEEFEVHFEEAVEEVSAKDCSFDGQTRSYRPMTVLVTFGNIMERILSQQLVNFFEEKLSPYLSAYRRNYSCQTALLRTLEELRIACDHKSRLVIRSLTGQV